MQYTSNFNFNLPEGTDLWNYLTQTNPNFTALDTLLKSIQDGTVTTATEVTSGTAHAVTRTLPDANVIRFTATGIWTLGDTMTIDGTPVTVVKPNGTSLQTGDYIIGSEVLGILRASQFTVYVGGGASTMDAEDVDYDNTVSGLTATDVQAAIDEEAASINTINSNLTQIGDYTLLASVNSTTSSVTLLDTLANYKAIVFSCSAISTFINPAYIPVGLFQSNMPIQSEFTVSGTRNYCKATYIDDAHVEITVNMPSATPGASLYGIK